MANELNIVLPDAGLIITCQVYLNAQLIYTVNLSEVSAGSGLYSGSMPLGASAGNYLLVFRSGGENVGGGSILWDGAQEVTLIPVKAKTDVLNTDRLAVCSTVDITAQQIASLI